MKNFVLIAVLLAQTSFADGLHVITSRLDAAKGKAAKTQLDFSAIVEVPLDGKTAKGSRCSLKAESPDASSMDYPCTAQVVNAHRYLIRAKIADAPLFAEKGFKLQEILISPKSKSPNAMHWSARFESPLELKANPAVKSAKSPQKP